MKPNQTVKQALKKAMQTRDLSPLQCVAYVCPEDKPKMVVDWSTLTTYLAGQEVGVCVCVGGGGGGGGWKVGVHV